MTSTSERGWGEPCGRLRSCFQDNEEVAVSFKSEALGRELLECINGMTNFYGVDEVSGEAVWLKWDNAVALRVYERE